ncbi:MULTISPECIES: transglutaminase-like domain-containing protein [Rhodomicrobium]|uniref:transglutaminase-like domain-containing protein n=1 Tax=Rhodomicrobium TaxID=1068 RepID=UPI000B4BEF38|nr:MULTISPECIES: transglutaminase-like domain-containing protein [Rhodomicrobium]
MFLSFYASHSCYSHPGTNLDILSGVDRTPKAIAEWAASFLQHPRGAESRLNGFSPEQAAHLELRSVAEILAVASKQSLRAGESSAPKVGGVCRDFAIMAVSRFRAEGIPARLRVGFADYIVPDRWEDHWICEWHDGQRWNRFDVEFAAGGQLDFDPTDVPGTRFLTAGEAWRRVADDPAHGGRFGVCSLNLQGEWFIAGSLFRDMAALRKLELKPWDYWGLAANLPWVSSDWPSDVKAMLNLLALQLTDAGLHRVGGPESLAAWTLPDQVVSYPRGEPVTVLLRTP